MVSSTIGSAVVASVGNSVAAAVVASVGNSVAAAVVLSSTKVTSAWIVVSSTGAAVVVVVPAAAKIWSLIFCSSCSSRSRTASASFCHWSIWLCRNGGGLMGRRQAWVPVAATATQISKQKVLKNVKYF